MTKKQRLSVVEELLEGSELFLKAVSQAREDAQGCSLSARVLGLPKNSVALIEEELHVWIEMEALQKAVRDLLQRIKEGRL